MTIFYSMGRGDSTSIATLERFQTQNQVIRWIPQDKTLITSRNSSWKNCIIHKFEITLLPMEGKLKSLSN
jgi:hypothetical protein